MLLHQQTVMVANLQQQLFQVQNDLRRVEDRNTRYHKAAGNLQTTFTTLKSGATSTDDKVCVNTTGLCVFYCAQRCYKLSF